MHSERAVGTSVGPVMAVVSGVSSVSSVSQAAVQQQQRGSLERQPSSAVVFSFRVVLLSLRRRPTANVCLPSSSAKLGPALTEKRPHGAQKPPLCGLFYFS